MTTTNPEGFTLDAASNLSSRSGLSAPQRAALLEDEVAAVGRAGVHAEVKALETAIERGLTPHVISASRPICSACQELIGRAGLIPTEGIRILE